MAGLKNPIGGPHVLFTSEQPMKNKMVFVGILSNKVALWSAIYSACVVYTKTIIIHLSVGESGGYLPRWAARQISTTIHLHFGV